MTSPGLLDVLPDGVVVADADQVVTVANDAAGRLLGAEVLVGHRLDEALALSDNAGRSWTECNRPYAGLATRTGIPEQAWVTTDGAEVLVTARLLRDVPLGPVTGVAVAIRSGRGRARLDRERSDLVATVSHELRSPLSGVKGFVQVMLNRWGQLQDEQKKLMLTTVHSDADRLSRLIAELLDVARIDTGRLDVVARPVDVAILARRCVESVQAATSRPLATELPEGLPRVWADPDKFTQVVTNLLENAVRHGAGTVTLTAEGGVDLVRLVVEDEGEGIPEDLRKRVATKYWTGSRSGGSGLGLYIVSGLVRAHGGALAIEDADSGGARLVVTWPTAAAGES